MNLQWEKNIHTDASCEQVYAYLSDFSRHKEWSRTLDRMEKISDGDASGVGAVYMTHERIEFPSESVWRNRIVRKSSARTRCEVRALVPGQRIVWQARPVPSFGGRADLSFDLWESDSGGTIIVQQVVEYYPRPVAFVLRKAFNITADGICEQLDRTLDVLNTLLDDLPSEGGVQQAAPGG